MAEKRSAGGGEFGAAIKRLRKSLGITQEIAAERLNKHYSDDRAYRKMENEGQIPPRHIAILLHTQAFGVHDPKVINKHLELLGYAPLTAAEAAGREPVPETKAEKREIRANPEPQPLAFTAPKGKRGITALALAAVILASAALRANADEGPWLLLISGGYAALYVVSLLLETAYEPQARNSPIITAIFCLILLSSAGANRVDAWLIGRGSRLALASAMAIIVAAAVVQNIPARRMLPVHSVVVSQRLQPYTAQAAHVKNACYFLLFAFLFWLPPLHTVRILRRESALGHWEFVRQITSEFLMVGRGIVSLSPGWLWVLFGVMIPLAIGMGAPLFNNLKEHPRKNAYTQLFYLRAFLYFALSLICVSWYTVELGLIRDLSTPHASLRAPHDLYPLIRAALRRRQSMSSTIYSSGTIVLQAELGQGRRLELNTPDLQSVHLSVGEVFSAVDLALDHTPPTLNLRMRVRKVESGIEIEVDRGDDSSKWWPEGSNPRFVIAINPQTSVASAIARVGAQEILLDQMLIRES